MSKEISPYNVYTTLYFHRIHEDDHLWVIPWILWCSTWERGCQQHQSSLGWEKNEFLIVITWFLPSILCLFSVINSSNKGKAYSLIRFVVKFVSIIKMMNLLNEIILYILKRLEWINRFQWNFQLGRYLCLEHSRGEGYCICALQSHAPC